MLTRKGLNVLSAGLTGERILFNRVALGDGILEVSDAQDYLQQVLDLEKMINWRMDVPIIECTNLKNGEVLLRVLNNNAKIGEGFFARERAVFAVDQETGKEILYAYINTGDASSFIPSNTGPIIKTIDFAIHTVIQNAKNVQAVIDQSFAYVSVADFKSHVESNHPHLNMPNHYLNVTDTNKLWAVDEDNHLHQMSVGNAREILLNGVDEKISENKVNIDELKLFTDASNELGLDANLMIVEDFNPATTVDDFEVKVLSCAKGGKLIGVESDVDILKGAYYWITDGINQELVQVAGVIYSTDYYHVTLANNLANDYIVSHTYLQRTTFKNGVGNVDLKNVTWTPRSLFKGIEANIERELIFDTSHKNKNALVIEGEGFCTTDGYFTLKNSYGGFELTDAEEDEGYAFSTDEEIATLFEG